jgi:hypothetical protein
MMTRTEYEMLRRKLTEEYEQNVAALDRVFKMQAMFAEDSGRGSNGKMSTPSTPKASPEGKEDKSDAGEHGYIIRTLREILPDLPHVFTILDVAQQYKNLNVDAEMPSIRSALKRMTERKEVRVIEQGIGRRPSRYSKV